MVLRFFFRSCWVEIQMINGNKLYEDHCRPFKLFQETWFVNGILKFPDIMSSVFNNSTGKNLYTWQFSFVHSMGYLLRKSKILLSFPLIWYKDTFISWQGVQFNRVFEIFALKNPEINFVLPFCMKVVVAPIYWQDVSVVMISWSFGIGRVILFVVSNAFWIFTFLRKLGCPFYFRIRFLPVITSSEGDKRKTKNLVCMWIRLCNIQYMIAIA